MTVMTMRRAISSAALSLLAAWVAGCEPPPGLVAHSALLPLEGACPEEPTGGLEFTSEVERLRVEVTGPGIDEPIEAEGSVTTLTIEGIPEGAERQVVLSGLASDGTATWRGVKKGITVEEKKDTEVEILLSKVADLSCPRSPLGQRRAFHTATLLDDGRVLLVGGAVSDVDASNTCGQGCTLLTATGSAEVYDPTRGTFTPAGTLSVPRMFHTATRLPDGQVAVVGGVSEALVVPVDDVNPFPIKPRLAPASLIEVWSPETGQFEPMQDDPSGPRMFHAATLTKDGYLLITGGIPSSAAVNDLSNAVRTSTLCQMGPLFCLAQLDAPMQRARAGHSAILLDNGDVLLWGGSVEIGDELGVAGFKPEVYRGGRFQMLDTAGFSSNQLNLFFAATTRYMGYRVVSAGGLVRGEDGRFQLSSTTKGGVTRGTVFVFDATPEGGQGAVSAGPYVGNQLDALVISEPRFLGGAAPLPGEQRALLAGGFASLDLEPSAGLEIYAEDPLSVQPVSVSGQPRILRSARGGLVATGLDDGTVVLTGGEVNDGGVRRPVKSAEIFADPVAPGASR